jgi:hypothetical protein
LPEIFFGSDVVAIEDGSSSMATYCHCDIFSDASANHVANSRASKVMKKTRRDSDDFFSAIDDDGHGFASLVQFGLYETCRLTGGCPRFSEVSNGAAIEMKHVLRDRDGVVVSRVFASGPAAFDNLGELTLKDNFVRPTVLDVLGARDYHARAAIDVRPRQGSNLTFTPGSDESKSTEVLKVLWQLSNDSLKLGSLEKPCRTLFSDSRRICGPFTINRRSTPSLKA